MSDLKTNLNTEEQTAKVSLFGSLTSDAWVLGGALALVYLGVAITYVNVELSYTYWTMMVPTFAIICFILQWFRARGSEVKWAHILGQQLLHWGGLLIAVVLAYRLLSAGGIPRATTGLVALLLFALVTFLYGVHLDRRFMAVGAFLGLSYVIMTYLQAYMWILLLIAVLTVAAALFMVKRAYVRRAPAGLETSPPETHDDELARSASPL